MSDARPTHFEPATFALRDTWFPLFHGHQIGRRPARRAMHGQPVVAWRQDGRLQVSENMPDAPEARRRASEFTGGTGTYPAIERYGYVWVWYGDPENASPELLPNVPHIPEVGMPRRFKIDNVCDTSYELSVENLLDLTHADFLHTALTGDSLSEDDEIEVFSTSETVTMVRTSNGRAIPKMQRSLVGSAQRQDVRAATVAHVRSGVCLLHGRYTPGMSIRMISPNNPEMPTRTRQPVTFDPQEMPTLQRNLFAAAVGHMVSRQDNWAFQRQTPQYLQPRELGDLSSRFDAAGLRYRKMFQQLVERQKRGDFSYDADGDPGRDVTTELGV